MSQHRISGLADPIVYDDAVTNRYVAARVQGLTDIIQDMRPVKKHIMKIFEVIGIIKSAKWWMERSSQKFYINFFNQAPLLHYMQLK